MTEPNPEYPNSLGYSLPVVSEEVMQSFLADNTERGKDTIISEADEQLVANNPELDRMVLAHMVAEGYANEDLSDPNNLILLGVFRRAIVITHELLRRQSMLESFQTQYQLGDSDRD